MGQRTGHRARALRCVFATALAAIAAAAVASSAQADAIDDFQGSWVDRALEAQFELGSGLPLANTPWIGTHNSFNSVAEMGPTLSDQDSNQQITPVDQLRLRMRSLELDVHRFPDVPGATPRVCHARGHDEGHLGCTIEKPLSDVLSEISGWLRLPGNRDQVLLLYLEDHLDDAQGYDDAAAAVNAQIGDLVYKPAGPGCTALPLALTREAIRAAGKQVVIVSDCGPGTGWNGVVFDWGAHVESRPFDYLDFPDCGPDYDRATYDSTLVRYYEDSTQLTQVAGDPDDGVTPPTAAAMARCGVDLIGLDQLTGPADPRLDALVWSWAHGRPLAPGSPRRSRCAIQRVGPKQPFGRFFDRRCNRRHRPACLGSAGWTLGRERLRWRDARAKCRRLDATLAVPRTGFEAQQLRLAMQAAGARTAWLGYRRAHGRWIALDSR